MKLRRRIESKFGSEGGNLFNKIMVPEYNSKNFIDKMYDAYLWNLKYVNYSFEWVKLKNIPHTEPNDWGVLGDKFLKDSELNKLKLAEDIIENGTYWPLYARHNKKGGIVLRDGLHRASSLKEAEKLGLLSGEKKFLLIFRDTRPFKDYKAKFKIASPHIVSELFFAFFINYYKNEISQEKIPYISKDKLLIYKEEDTGDAAMVMMSVLIRNAIFEYNQNSDVNFKGSPIVNKEEVFYEWRMTNEKYKF